MRYCLNPQCSNPRNPDETTICYSCGSKLLLGDRYCAIKLIGQGGFGRTFLAQDDFTPVEASCIIKQFYPEGQNNARGAAQLFEQEARRLQQLGEHPQIPRFYKHIEQDKHQYIIQEFIDGPNLSEELAEQGPFNESQIKALLTELLPVLRFIHQGEVIHRDIKPANIIRCRQTNKLFIVDFGAAKYATATALGKTGTIIGSAEYIAPEQLRGKAIFASDIYSLGVTCIYLLTQISPFDLFDISEDSWIWRDYLLNNPISDELGLILDKMVINSVKERYRSVEDIMQDLKIPLSLAIIPQSSSDLALIYPPITKTWQCFQTLKGHSESINCLAFNPDGKRLASGSEDKTIKIWYLQTGQDINTLVDHTEKVNCITFSPDGELLASCGWDRYINIWNWKDRKIISQLTGHTNWINTLLFTPNGKFLISGGYDKTLKFWQLKTGQEINSVSLRGSQSWVNCLSFHPQKPIFASGHWDNVIKFWDLRTQQQIYTLLGHINSVHSLAFSPNGKILASGSADKSIKLWNVEKCQSIRHLTGHSDRVNCIAFSPDGKILASGSSDKTIKLWYLNTSSWKLVPEDPIITLKGHSRGVRAIAFSPDGKILASGSEDKTIKLWQCEAF